MTETPPRPKRRRWQWAVLAVFLFITGVAGWWFWPRGDSRFVGKWLGSLEGKPFSSRVDFEFYRNGRGWAEAGQFPAAFEMDFWWSVQGNKLLLSTFHKPFVIQEFLSSSEILLIHPEGRNLELRRVSE